MGSERSFDATLECLPGEKCMISENDLELNLWCNQQIPRYVRMLVSGNVCVCASVSECETIWLQLGPIHNTLQPYHFRKETIGNKAKGAEKRAAFNHRSNFSILTTMCDVYSGFMNPVSKLNFHSNGTRKGQIMESN